MLAIITGASRGLGLALARSLADRGWSLVIDARTPGPLRQAAADLEGRGSHVIAIPGDVADPAHREALAEAVGDRPLAALINNAGTLGPSPRPPLLDFPPEALDGVFRTNVTAQLAVIQAVHHALVPRAAILNITSDAGAEAYEGWGGYGASKAALGHLTAILAKENAQWRIYTVDPGDLRTQMHQDAFPGEDISDRDPPDVAVPGLLALISGGDIPSGRYAARKLIPVEVA